ncbi:RNA polymerase factor sigma-70 [Arhodomonas sp. AD133]|uniref:RNA polymerase factor sigma-70 n=1 Tax=Arhodomonas sp. AD133 TaxID=3415009 RepID=UPI003EBB7797
MRASESATDLQEAIVEHRATLCQIAGKILGSPERADDVVQDAYLKVAEADSVLEVKRPVSYIYQVVRNLAIDRHRRRAFESGVFTSDEAARQVPGHSGTPESIEISREDLSLVARALEELPERTRRAFELYRLGGYTQRQVAERLGVSTALVNFMIRDALNHCRARVGAR